MLAGMSDVTAPVGQMASGQTGAMDSQQSAAMIRLQDVVKRYRKTTALRGVDLTVARGQLFGLIGPDGAGKSSMMHIVAGVLAQDAGEVVVNGVAIRDERSAEAVKAQLGLMPQGLGLNLYPTLSVEENLRFFADLHAIPPDVASQRIDQLLAMTQMSHFRDRRMQHLSGGMKQKLGLMCTLIHEPQLIILDEPTTGVDPISRQAFWELLNQLVRERCLTALVSTAYMDEAARFDAVALMHDGQILEQGPPDSLTAGQAATVLWFPAEARDTLRPCLQNIPAMRLRMDAGQLRAWLPQAQRDALVQKLDSPPLRETPPTLEDLFMAAVGAPHDLTFDWAPPPSVSAPVEIRADGLVRRFGDFTAVDHVFLQVRAGEIFGLLGANGAGKSTLIRMLTGILPPTAGSGEVAGQPLGKASRQVRQRIGYMSQQFSLYPQLSVLENLRLFGRIYGLRRRQLQQRIEWGLDWTGLVTDKNEAAGRLPLGKRQRLALLAAILHEPEVLFLDEPTSGVDPLGRQQFWGLLHTLVRKEGVALLVTTHAMNEAENCHNLALMRQGRVVASGSPRQLRSAVRSRFGEVYALRVDDTARALATLRQRGWLAFAQGREVHVFVAGDDASLGRLKAQLAEAGCVISAIERVEPTMEEVFVSMIEGTA